MGISGAIEDRGSRTAIAIGIAIVLLTMAAVWGIFRIVGSERDFELQRWQQNLEKTASGAEQAAEKVLTESRATLRMAASNPSVGIYMSELAAAGGDGAGVAQGAIKRGYVDAFVRSLGSRGAFSAAGGAGKGSALALYGTDGALVSATPAFRVPEGCGDLAISSLANGRADNSTTCLSNGSAYLVLAVPVMPLQVTSPDAAPVGFLLGIRALGPQFWSDFTVARGGDIDVWLLKADGQGGVLLGPPSSGAKTGERVGGEVLQAALKTPSSLRAGELAGPGNVLVLARNVPETDWNVVSFVPSNIALKGVDEQLRSLLLSLLMALLAVIAAVLALWRHGVALREREAARLERERADALAEREARRVRLYWTLTNALLEAIDQRDPGAAAHSRRVAQLATKLAQQLGLDEGEVETTRLAGALLNAGKLYVKQDLLLKAGPLSLEERREISAANDRWLDQLSQVSLELPLGRVLKRAQELMSGLRDPESNDAADDTTGREAEIVVVANAFVALISPRAYRDRKAPEEAVEYLRSSEFARARILDCLDAVLQDDAMIPLVTDTARQDSEIYFSR